MLLTTCCAVFKSLQLCLTFWDPVDCSLPGSSVHGILQARILEWVSMPFSRPFFRTRDEPVFFMSPALTGGFFTISATWDTDTQILVCMKKIHIFFWSTMKSLSVSFNSDGSTFIKFLFLFFFVLNAAFVINVLHKASVWWMSNQWY